ncbi:MAG TPA: hypothetical protein PLT47_06475 [Bacteroidales bacterium]|nr:hypothetical protein [Bacteroidales bacterium]
MLNRLIIFCALLILVPVVTISQTADYRLDSLKLYSNTIASENPDFKKYEANEKMELLLEKIFASEKYFEFPFDSLKKIAVLTAPDKKFKLLTWGIAKENGNYEFFGYLVLPENQPGIKKYFKLIDKTSEVLSPENDITDHNKWYGAIYYDIIASHYQGKKQYTLLGWKGNNTLTTKKVVEILTFRSNGTPVFGKRIFRKNNKATRHIFEFSARTSMLLRYESQTLHTVVRPAKTVKSSYSKKDKNSNKAITADKKVEAKIKTTRARMIIFDRLSPVDSRTSKYMANLEGQYQFYVPETNIYDAFIFENGRWVFVKDVDARNPQPDKKKKFAPPQL